ncbi:lower tail fiber [Nitrososphaeria virus YSH_1032793]|uniref:Lower tail fiber n=1 Tax=Nitrososphaeria virus YSH_1032793 TaxID=3071320 RepID=A0A976UAD1_9CAUD|nr:lower tail fiber [Yangshan Harbor Nitrososphaeria virus]UVF62239.1 lower tail fiber [Nitrososphaeria virus YSH_1032793]
MSLSDIEKIILQELNTIKSNQEEHRQYFERRMDETCNTLTELGTSYDTHLETEKNKLIEHQTRIDNKYKKITVVLGLISGLSVVLGFSKYFIQ